MKKYIFVVAVIASIFVVKMAHAAGTEPVDNPNEVAACPTTGETTADTPSACNLTATNKFFTSRGPIKISTKSTLADQERVKKRVADILDGSEGKATPPIRSGNSEGKK